jgi:molybdopterin/thiamine biosynthesis adenylyltransferase
MPLPELNDEERATYEWQMWVPGFGEAGQRRLKNASVLISRVGGLGSPVAYALAAAGIGRIVLAHAGNVKHSDLNRQLLMTHDWLGKPRVASASRRLRELNPRLEVVPVAENIDEGNAARLVGMVDLVIDAAPLFQERFLMNRECVRQGKPLIDAAMYDMEGQVMTIIPGETPCLACVYPEFPEAWKREFPVFGAVSALAANVAALEVIKVIAGFGETLGGKMLVYNTRNMQFHTLPLARRPDCEICGVRT